MHGKCKSHDILCDEDKETVSAYDRLCLEIFKFPLRWNGKSEMEIWTIENGWIYIV